MTRWARAHMGSARVPHSGTKWQEMNTQNKEEAKKERSEKEVHIPKAALSNKEKKRLKRLKRLHRDDESKNKDNPEDGGVAGALENTTHPIEKTSLKQNTEKMKKNKREKKLKIMDMSKFIAPSERPEHQPSVGLAAQLEQIEVECEDEKEEMAVAVKKVLKSEERRVKRATQRAKSMICFHCRKTGHDMSECPATKDDMEQGMKICFKCGSMEHKLQKCRVKTKNGELPYAKCFICGEKGHLSSQCPDNPRGLYPNGGCCKICGSVEHYKKDCPENQAKQGVEEIRLERLASCNVDDEVSLKPIQPPPPKRPKFVVF